MAGGVPCRGASATRAVEQQPRRFELGCHVGELPLNSLQVGESPPGVRPLARVVHGVLDRTLRGADAHRGVSAPLVVEMREQSAEGVVVAGEQHIGRLDAHVVESELGFGHTAQAHLLVHACDAHAIGRQVDDNGADLTVRELAPHETRSCMVPTCHVVLVRREPIAVAVLLEFGPHERHGAAGLGFGDTDAEQHLPGRCEGEPSLLHGGVAEVLDRAGGPLKISCTMMAEDTSARDSSSRTIAASMSPSPAPPYSSATVTAKSPARFSASHDLVGNSSVSSSARRSEQARGRRPREPARVMQPGLRRRRARACLAPRCGV